MNIGIVGYGYVGQATHKLLGDTVTHILDVDSSEADWDAAKTCDLVFVCVPTPSNDDGSCNTSNIGMVLNHLGTGPTYVIRSTVPWTWKPNGYKIVAAPEFLNQNEFLDAHRNHILGGAYKDLKLIVHLYDKLGLKYRLTTWDAAWQVKYTSNMYGAFKTLFWEMIQDITGNERLVYNLWKSLNLPPNDMAQVGMDGYRGFGGACFPKDTKAMADLTHHPLIESMLQYNESLQ